MCEILSVKSNNLKTISYQEISYNVLYYFVIIIVIIGPIHNIL
jgi:hypothetical protein